MKTRPCAFLFEIACLISLAACGEILNVDGVVLVDPAASGGAGGAGGGGGGPATCQAGEFHCEGPALQLCDSREGAFRTVRVCSDAALCCDDPARCAGQPGCLAPACSAGDFRCEGQVLEACKADQTGFAQVDVCASALHCNAGQGRCTDQPCDSTLREQQCNGPYLEQCQPGRSEWSSIDNCLTQRLCSLQEPPASCAPAACRISTSGNQPSPYVCVSGNLMRCNDEQTGWEQVETCLNTANCHPLINELVGDPYAPRMPTAQLERLGCTPPGCAPGRYRCDGAELMLCGVNRTGYVDPAGSCLSPRHCNASAGRCTPEPCVLGERQCSGDEYQVCAATGWEHVDTCSSGAPCDAQTGCQRALCSGSEYRCNGSELERCNVERNGWIPVATCEAPGLCNIAAKRCDEPVCEPDARRCTADGLLQRCNAGLDAWESIANCAAAANLAVSSNASASCDPGGTGQCLQAPLCTTGALRCNDVELERCRDNAWRPYQRCATPAQCDLVTGSCLEPICSPGSFRCVTLDNPPRVAEEGGSRLGLALEVCNSEGTGFEPRSTCTPLELCDEVHGQCDICNPTLPAQCAGSELLLCTADGQEQTLYKSCTQGCVDGGTEGASRATCREDLATTPTN